jgi:endogenous inhibitor of DNA gyrase (YacG/DUF329 family)
VALDKRQTLLFRVLRGRRRGGSLSKQEAGVKRCAQCGGKFGLIRHRWHFRQFCSAKCREKFFHQRAKDTDKIHPSNETSFDHGIAITTNLNESVN